jgi:hypothetical protein
VHYSIIKLAFTAHSNNMENYTEDRASRQQKRKERLIARQERKKIRTEGRMQRRQVRVENRQTLNQIRKGETTANVNAKNTGAGAVVQPPENEPIVQNQEPDLELEPQTEPEIQEGFLEWAEETESISLESLLNHIMGTKNAHQLPGTLKGGNLIASLFHAFSPRHGDQDKPYFSQHFQVVALPQTRLDRFELRSGDLLIRRMYAHPKRARMGVVKEVFGKDKVSMISDKGIEIVNIGEMGKYLNWEMMGVRRKENEMWGEEVKQIKGNPYHRIVKLGNEEALAPIKDFYYQREEWDKQKQFPFQAEKFISHIGEQESKSKFIALYKRICVYLVNGVSMNEYAKSVSSSLKSHFYVGTDGLLYEGIYISYQGDYDTNLSLGSRTLSEDTIFIAVLGSPLSSIPFIVINHIAKLIKVLTYFFSEISFLGTLKEYDASTLSVLSYPFEEIDKLRMMGVNSKGGRLMIPNSTSLLPYISKYSFKSPFFDNVGYPNVLLLETLNDMDNTNVMAYGIQKYYGLPITLVQKALNKLGYKVTEDGTYGDEMREVILRFQKEKDLTRQEGKVGFETLSFLDALMCENANISFPFYFDRYKLKGLNQDMTAIADDVCYGDGKTVTDHFRYTKEMMEKATIPKTIEEAIPFSDKTTFKEIEVNIFDPSILNETDESKLWTNLENLVRNTSVNKLLADDLQAVVLAMVQRFRNKEGGEFSDERLTRAVREHRSTIEFCKRLEDEMKKLLVASKGFVIRLYDNTIYRSSKRHGKPVFGSSLWHPVESFTNTFGGLRITLNDTWAYEVFITHYELNTIGEYNLQYQVNLYDHFGLDLPDIEKFYNYPMKAGIGFQSWFVLQHLWNYPPFITHIQFTKSIQGKIIY